MVEIEDDDAPISTSLAANVLVARKRREGEISERNKTFHRGAENLTQANRRLILLNQSANNLGDNPQEQLNAAFEIVADELSAKFYFNYRTNESSPDTLFLESSRGLEHDQELLLRQISFGQSLCGQVAQSRGPVILEDIHLRSDEATAWIRAMGIKAYAGLPLVAHGHMFGIIAVGSTILSAFSVAEIALLKTLADQSASMLDRCRLIQKVRENEANLTDFFDNATMGLHWVGPDGIILRANNAELELLGYSREEYVGHHIAEFHASREIIDDILARLLRDEKLHDYEAQLLCKDGSVKDVQINSSGLWKDGKFVHSRCFTRDISDRTTAENKLRVSEIRYRRLFEAAQDGVLLLDPGTCKITDANPFMTTLLDYSHDQLVGKQLFEIGLLKDEDASQDMFRKLKSEHQVRYENLPLESQTGQHQEVEVVANLYDEDGRDVIQCNIRDITERKRAEAHANLLMNEVNHRSKNLLSVVQAVARQTARGGDPATFVRSPIIM